MRVVDLGLAVVGEQGREMRVRPHAEHRDIQCRILAQLLDELALVLRGGLGQHRIGLFGGGGGVHRGEHTVTVGSAGHGDIHTFTIRLGQQIDDGQQRARGHSLRQYLRIGVYDGFTFCHVHSLYYGSTLGGYCLGLTRSSPCETTSL